MPRKDTDDILTLYGDLHRAHEPVISQMRDVIATYNDDLQLDLPEIERGEKAAVANLVLIGVEDMGKRISSTSPDVFYPPTRPGFDKHEEASRLKRMATLGFWQQSGMDTLLQRRSRQLIALARSPVMIRPCPELQGPRWNLRDPMSAFPAPTENPDDPAPPYCVFAYTRTWQWIKHHYPDAAEKVERPRDVLPSTKFTLLEYVDDEQITLMVLGGTQLERLIQGQSDMWAPSAATLGVNHGALVSGRMGTEKAVVLESVDNRADICTAVVPGRVTLDRPKGQYDGVIGKYIAQARLFALELIAVEKGVFEDEWLIGRPNEEPKIISEADGRLGQIGKVMGGDFQRNTTQPGYMTNPTRDYLERTGRIEAGITAESGGEAQSNVRTGRRADQVLSAAIDFTIQAAQKMLQVSMQEENRRAIAVDKAYYGSQAKSFYVSWEKARGQTDYTPADLWDSSNNIVRFPFAGTDINNFLITSGQRMGMGVLSEQTFMEQDPMIPDPELERDRIVAESLRRALQAGIEQQANQGVIPPDAVARIAQLVEENKMGLADAVLKVQAEFQEKQATSGEPGAPDGPVDPNSPAAQPGIAVPGVGAEAGTAIPGLPSSMENLDSLLGQLYPVEATMARRG